MFALGNVIKPQGVEPLQFLTKFRAPSGGAVNEAFADVFGTAAEFYMQDPGTDVLRADYQIGEDVPEMGVFHGARGPIRSLSDPASIYVNTSAQTVRYPEHSDGLLKFGIFVASGRLYRAPVVFLDNTYFKLNGLTEVASTGMRH